MWWRQSTFWTESDRPPLTVASRSLSPKGVLSWPPSPDLLLDFTTISHNPQVHPGPSLTLRSSQMFWARKTASFLSQRVRESCFNSNRVSERKEQLIKDEKQAVSRGEIALGNFPFSSFSYEKTRSGSHRSDPVHTKRPNDTQESETGLFCINATSQDLGQREQDPVTQVPPSDDWKDIQRC